MNCWTRSEFDASWCVVGAFSWPIPHVPHPSLLFEWPEEIVHDLVGCWGPCARTIIDILNSDNEEFQDGNKSKHLKNLRRAASLTLSPLPAVSSLSGSHGESKVDLHAPLLFIPTAELMKRLASHVFGMDLAE